MGAIFGQGIQDFYRNAQRKGLARDFQFRITNFTVNGYSLFPDDLVFLKTASLPGKTLNTVPATFMGLDFQIPAGVSFENNKNWSVKFYASQDYGLRQFLEMAIGTSFDINSSSGLQDPPDLNANIIDLTLIDDQMNETFVYSLLGAVVTKIDDMNFDTTKAGGIQEIGASIAYQYWVSSPSSGVVSGSPESNVPGNQIDIPQG